MSRRLLSHASRALKSTTTRSLSALPACGYIPAPYTGPSKEEVLSVRKGHVNPAVHRQTFFRDPPLFVEGKGQYLFDEQGERYLDLIGGICTISAGHNHDKINGKIAAQLGTLTHTANILLHPNLSKYTKAMAKKLPKELSVIYFCNSGSEANDLAMLMARAYTGNLNIVGLRRAYHGASASNISLTTLPLYRAKTMPTTNISHTMNADPFRGLWGGSKCRDGPCQTLRSCDCVGDECNAAANYAEQYRDHVRTICPPGAGLAAFIGEGIGGMGAALQQTKGFYNKVYDITKEYGGVNIMDEVQTGFGRLGSHYWGFEYHGVMPDIITAAKSIGNGFPLAMCATSPEIAEAFANSSLHFNTFGGNALQCAAGLATLEAIEEDGLQENCAVVGTHFLEGFNKLRTKHEVVGDCRGKGLFMAMELVTDKASNNPLPVYHIMALLEALKDRRCIFGRGGLFGNCLRIQPPMCVTLEDADYTLAALDAVLTKYAEGLRRAYHGASASNISLTTLPLYRAKTMPTTNISHTMNADPFRGLWGGSKCRDGPCQTLRSCDCVGDECNAAANYAEQYRDHVRTICPPGAGLAAFIGEGIGGMGAALQQTKGFYNKVYDITKEYGGVNIMDEVQTGFGRLGSHYWGFEYHGVMPDIITAAKSIGNGFPLAMCATSPEIAEAFANSSLHFNTFGGNALQCAAGLATLEAIEEDGLQENCAVVGTHFLEGFNKLRTKHEVVGDCRGKGLFMAMELVTDKASNNPLPVYHIMALLEALKDRRCIFGRGGLFGNCLRIQPPMCVTLEDADYTLAALDAVLTEYAEGKLDVESFNPNK
eukprot:sb/3462102/